MVGEKQVCTIQLSEAVNITNVNSAYSVLLSALDREEDLVIDIRDTTDIDLTFVQLIESARRSMAERGRSFRLREPAEGAVLQVLQRGGFLDQADSQRADFWLQGTSKQ